MPVNKNPAPLLTLFYEQKNGARKINASGPQGRWNRFSLSTFFFLKES